MTPAAGARPRGDGYENRLVALFALSGGICALDVQAAFYLMPFIAPELAISNFQVGLIGTAGLIGWSLAGFAAGPLADRIGRRRPVLVGAFLCFALFSVGSALATSFGAFFLTRLLVGLAEGPVIPIEQAILLQESAPHRLGLNMGLAQNFGAQLVGSLIAPLLLVWIALGHGWRAAFLVAAVPGLAMAALIAWGVREPPLPVGAREPFLAQVRAILAHRDVRLCVLIGSCVIAWYFLQLSFLPLYLTRTLGFDPTTMSRVMSVFGGSGLLAAAIVPAISDRIGRRATIVLFSALGALGALGVILAGRDAWAIALILVPACSISGTIPLFMATVPLEAVAPRHAAAATGLVMGLSQIVGGISAPLIAGALGDRYGLQVVLWFSAGLAAVAAAAALFLRSPSRPRRSTAPGR